MRRRWLIVVAAILVVGIAIGVRTLTRTDTKTTALSVDDALERYRESTTAATSAALSTTAPATTSPAAPTTTAAPLPAAGVYVYDTNGSDSVDALGGAQHAYPAKTTITVTASDCGITNRWDVAVERWEETTACLVDDGVQQTKFVAYHQFFGSGDTDNETCTGDPRPLAAPPGTVWRYTCSQGGDVSTWEGEVVGSEPLVVEGNPVDALHVVTVFDNPATGDDQRLETWYLAGSDLILREIGQRDTTDPSPIGDVHYHERYEIVLASMAPQR